MTVEQYNLLTKSMNKKTDPAECLANIKAYCVQERSIIKSYMVDNSCSVTQNLQRFESLPPLTCERIIEGYNCIIDMIDKSL